MRLNFTFSVIIALGLTLLFTASCKNDVEVFAPQTDVTLVYGLLNADDTIHQIKINRVFQGADAVENLAKNPALSEYDNLKAILFELNTDGFGKVDTTNQWTLTETTITNKDSGYFYYPNQKVYEVNAKLDKTKRYAIWIDKLNGFDIVESSTELIVPTGAILIKPFGLSFLGLSLADDNGPLDKVKLEMKMPINGKVMDVFLDFSWKDEYKDGSTSGINTIAFKVGTYVVSNIPVDQNDNIQVSAELNPTAFYEFIASKVSVVPDGSNIKQRVPEDIPLNFRFIIGGNEFNTYLEVAAPSSSILETKPEYTNVKNGVGIFSCRTFQGKESKMSKKSIVYLVDGEITAGRKFCNYANSTDPNYCF
jgi:hypothetical protein